MRGPARRLENPAFRGVRSLVADRREQVLATVGYGTAVLWDLDALLAEEPSEG